MTKTGGSQSQRFDTAVRLFAEGDLAGAGDLFARLLERDRHNAPALHLLGVIRAREYKLEEAIDLLRRSLASGGQSAEVHNSLGLVLNFAGRQADAIAEFERSLAINGADPVTHNNLAMALASTGKRPEAEIEYRKALELHPGYAEAHNNLGNLLSNDNRSEEALGHFRRAIALNPALGQARYNLGLALSKLGRDKDAEAEYRRALAAEPNSAMFHFLLGNILHDQGRYQEAVGYYRLALKLDPKFARAANRLGLVLKEMGQFEEAAKAYETALEVEPKRGAHYFGLVSVRRLSHGEPALQEIEKLAGAIEALPEADQLDLHFALGIALANQGENDRAFEHFTRGNRLRRDHIRYNEERILGRMDRTRGVFNEELIARWMGTGENSELPVFIVGMPRSGSTLVEQILASHPLVHAAGEVEYLRTIIGSLKKLDTGLEFPEIALRLDADQLRSIGTAYVERHVRKIAPSAPRPLRITDKLPFNFRHAGLIAMTMANARIIHTKRNPVDTCLSCFSTHFRSQPFSCDLAELGRYYRKYAELMSHWRTVLPMGKMLEVQYEDLVDNFENGARRIIEYCGLPWNDACLDFYKAPRPVKTASVAQVRQPIYRSSVKRWRPSDELLKPLLDELQPVLQT